MSGKPRTRTILDLCERALELDAEARADFLAASCGGDEALRRSVDSVLLAVAESGEFLAAETAATARYGPDPGQHLEGFRILEKIGEGGMGAVYLADRGGQHYSQRVALKIVRGQFLVPELARRFDVERQILAGLSHPYIAALIDGGTTADGIPYLAMEYIEGQAIDEYCDERKLGVRERIRLIQQVAMAVQYAHQNLVVHRDLKPTNVLVTPDGIPKLLDFGIAKLITAEAGPVTGETTVFGRGALTPDYASPEQILESRVTTASDVYSLGVLTYQLLAGERPYRIETTGHREMIRTVEGLSIPQASKRLDTFSQENLKHEVAALRGTTPERLRKTLAGDLDNILMKALDREPERRYPSIAAFSADLGRYLDGLPVEARPDSVGYRARRFIQRHRIGVTVSAAAAAGLLAALGLITDAYIEAEHARAEADRRFEQVRAIARTLMFDVYDEIEQIPGSVSARRLLASTAQEYLETLTDNPTAPPDVRFDAATGYSRLSSILNRQAVDDVADREQGPSARQRALELLTSLIDDHPDPAGVYRALGQIRSNYGSDLTYLDNDPEAGREQIELALAAFREAERLHADAPDIVAERLTAQRRYADTFKWQQEYDRAINVVDELIAATGASLQRWPDDPGIRKAKADAYRLRGELNYFLGQLERALADYGVSIDGYRALAQSDAPDQAIDNALVIVLWSRGNALIELERPEEAAADYLPAISTLELQAARDPEDAETGRRLAILRSSLAQARVRLDEADEAVRLMEKTNAWFEAQAAADPDTPGVQRSVAVNYRMTGDILASAERQAEACDWFRRSLDTWLAIDRKFGLSDFDRNQPEEMRELLEACNG